MSKQDVPTLKYVQADGVKVDGWKWSPRWFDRYHRAFIKDVEISVPTYDCHYPDGHISPKRGSLAFWAKELDIFRVEKR